MPEQRSEHRRRPQKHSSDRKLDHLLDLLVENATVVLSGTKLASELHISVSTLWEWIKRLRSLGISIRGVRGSGYRLLRIPDVPTPRSIHQQLPSSLFTSHIHHFYSTSSTMNEAARLAAADASEGTLIVAEQQSAGRGRLGHHWESEAASGLYFTLILRPAIRPAAAPVLTLLAGVAVAEAIWETTRLAVDIRWPNDILIDDEKCAGILVEMTAEPERVAHILVGVGINVHQRKFPAGMETEPTSLRLKARRSHSRIKVLVSVLKRLEHYYNLFCQQGPAVILSRFTSISSYATDRKVRVTDGATMLTGTTAGLTPEGILLVRRDSGEMERVLSGHVRPL
jgi:BirA family biotin operon repressor/biotin-[acetyl-CoA-carboxylase] ligase